VVDAQGRWKVAVSAGQSEKGVSNANSVSFVNSIWTPRGGTHQKHVMDQIVEAIMIHIKKNYKDLEVTDRQVKWHNSNFVDVSHFLVLFLSLNFFCIYLYRYVYIHISLCFFFVMSVSLCRTFFCAFTLSCLLPHSHFFCSHLCISIFFFPLSLSLSVFCVDLCVYIYKYMHTSIHAYIYTHVSIYIYRSMCMNSYMYISIHLHVFNFSNMYMYIHKFIISDFLSFHGSTCIHVCICMCMYGIYFISYAVSISNRVHIYMHVYACISFLAEAKKKHKDCRFLFCLY